MAMLVMLFLIGTFGLNFPIFISTMAVGVFHADARGYGLLSSIMAIGTIAGALLGAGREQPRFARCSSAPGCSGSAARSPRWRRATGCSAPRWSMIGVACADLPQLDQQPDAALDRAGDARAGDGDARGIALGGTPIGAPIVGWVADHFGPRWALGVGAAAGFAAAECRRLCPAAAETAAWGVSLAVPGLVAQDRIGGFRLILRPWGGMR